MSDGLPFTLTSHGFTWGPVTVRRVWDYEGRACMELITATGRVFEVYVSATGRSLRVFCDGDELKKVTE